jgi:NMD protein affecting ribosome stability and mRNA decay
MGQLLICLRVTSTIQLIDPATLQLREVDGSHYWANPFEPIASSKRLVKVTFQISLALKDKEEYFVERKSCNKKSSLL